MPKPDFSNSYDEIASILRVNHAGEYGAKRIYQGQLKFIQSKEDYELIQEMLEGEEVHLNYFENELRMRYIRPTIFMPIWHSFGFLLGAISGMIGTKTAMSVTQNVEEVIEKHYQSQINYLEGLNTDKDLLDNITKFRLDEINHKDIAIINNSEKSFLNFITSKIVKFICCVAIDLSK